MKELFYLALVVLLGRSIQAQESAERDVNINFFSLGGSESALTSLNHVNMQTVVMLNTRFKHEWAISSWQFYAESTMPFYPSLWRVVEESGRNFTVELVDFNRVVPVKTGYQEISIPTTEQIWPTAELVLGIFYVKSEQTDDSVSGTVPMETYARAPTEGVTDELVTSIVDNTPKTPLEKGYTFSCKTANNTARLLALRAVFEPEINKRRIPKEFHEDYMVKGANVSIPEINVDRHWGTICDDGGHDIALAWGNQVCQRAYDFNFTMVTSFPVNITTMNLSVPIAPPILQNPTCFARDDQMIGQACVSSGSCDVSKTRAIVCAKLDDLEKTKKRVNDAVEDAWNFMN